MVKNITEVTENMRNPGHNRNNFYNRTYLFLFMVVDLKFYRDDIIVPEVYFVTVIVITRTDRSSCLAKRGSERAGYSFHCFNYTVTLFNTDNNLN